MNSTIEITLQPDQTARTQIETALTSVPPRACPKHAYELLKFQYQNTVNGTLMQQRVTNAMFKAVFYRCGDCVHNKMDNVHAINCAAQGIASRWLYKPTDPDGKPLPWEIEQVEISPDESLHDAMATWVTKMNDSGMKCRGSLLKLCRTEPVVAKTISIHLHFDSCPSCVLEEIGLTSDEARASFNNFVCEPTILNQYLRLCRKYADNPKGVLLLHGGPGTGKTHLGTSVMRERIVQGKPRPVYYKMRRLFDRHWQSIRPVAFDVERPDSPLEHCQRADLLMLDELALLPTHFNAEDFLLDIFEARVGNYLPTIITSNLSRTELEAAIGSRLFDRLRRASAATLEFAFKSKRAEFNEDYLRQISR